MNILVYYNSATLEGRLSAMLTRLKYYGLSDSTGAANEYVSRDCNAVVHVDVDSLIYAETAGYYHRIFNFLADGVGTGQMDAADVTNLTAALIGSSTDAKSDDYVVTVVPSIFQASLYNTRNSVQIVWNGLFNFKLNPTARGKASAGGAATLSVAGTPWTVNAYANYYVHIISGIGRGQSKGISSNTTSQLTVKTAWSINPDSTSQFYITQWPSKIYPYYWMFLGGEGGQTEFGTATGGGATSLIDGGKVWTNSVYIGMYVYIYKGTGIGSYGAITANNAATLTVPSGLTTTPDGTSRYVIGRSIDVFKMTYLRNYLWAYASNPASNSHINAFNDLFENIDNLYQQDPVVSIDVNFPLYASDIEPKGAAAFEYEKSATP